MQLNIRSDLSKAFDRVHPQQSRSIFACLNCIGNESESRSQINPHNFPPSLRRSRLPKVSLKNASLPTNIIVPLQSEITLAKSNVKPSPLQAKINIESAGNKIDENVVQGLTTTNKFLTQTSSQKSFLHSMLQKSNSLRSTNDTIFQFNSSKPKINFIYQKKPQANTQNIKSKSIISEQSLPPLPVLELCPKISEVKVDFSLLQSEIQGSKSGDRHTGNKQSSQKSSLTSPLNKLYKNTQKQLLVSLDSRNKSSNSFQSSQKLRLKRFPSLNEPFSKAAMKIRQTVSIRQPEEESSDMVSVVITNSLMGSFTGLLIPIDENEMQTRLSEYKD